MPTKVLEVNVDDLYSGGVFSLVKNVIIHKKSDIKIDIASMERFVNQNNVVELEEYGTNIYYFGYEGSKIKKQYMIYRNLKELLLEKKYDYIHIHSDTAVRLFLMGLAAKHAGNKNIILHSHASDIDGNNRYIKLCMHYISRGFLKRIGTKFAACSSKASKWMFPCIDKKDIKIIYNGIDLDKFKFDKDTRIMIRKKLNISDELLIGHVGRFDYSKNHIFMLKIARELQKRKIRCKYLFVGDGPWFESIKSKAYNLGVAESCVFYGTSDRVNELYQAMDVFTLPSHNEGFGICAIEAETSGLPSIFSDEVPLDVKIIDEVRFLPINRYNVGTWVDMIIEMKEMTVDRDLIWENLNKEKMSINNTVNGFMNLYVHEKDGKGLR